MVLCFAALIKVLKECSKPKVYNKTLCGALVMTVNEYYGGILEVNDTEQQIKSVSYCRRMVFHQRLQHTFKSNAVSMARSIILFF